MRELLSTIWRSLHERIAGSNTNREQRAAKQSVGLLGPFGRTAFLALLLFGLCGIPALYASGVIGIEAVNQLGRYVCFALLALSLDLVWGYGGMLSLCQFLFFALGGYAIGMYLAHHGGPEGVIDANNWGKIPACLFVVYPGAVGQSAAEWTVPWFWKPFWNLWSAIILGVLVPGVVAGAIGFFLFRSRVRGVFFAVVTQAIVLASWNVFCINDMQLGGTNGLTRFDRVVFQNEEQIQITLLPDQLAGVGLEAGPVRAAIAARCDSIEAEYRAQADVRRQLVAQSRFVRGPVHEDRTPIQRRKTDGGIRLSLTRSLHPWEVQRGLKSLEFGQHDGRVVRLADVATVQLVGLRLNAPSVKLGLYLLSVLALAACYLVCRQLMRLRLGRILVAVRDNESRLSFAGFQPHLYKTAMFALAAMIAAIAGMLYVPQMRIITPTLLEPKLSLLVVVWVAVGGRGSLSGPIIGALTVNYLYSMLTSRAPDAWPLVLGGMFICVTQFMPDGIVGLGRRWMSWSGDPADPNLDAPQDATDVPNWMKTGAPCVAALALTATLVLVGWNLIGQQGGSPVVTGIMLLLLSASTAAVAGFSLALLNGRVANAQRLASAALVSLALLAAIVVWGFFINTLEDGLLNWTLAGLQKGIDLVYDAPILPLVLLFHAAVYWCCRRLKSKPISQQLGTVDIDSNRVPAADSIAAAATSSLTQTGSPNVQNRRETHLPNGAKSITTATLTTPTRRNGRPRMNGKRAAVDGGPAQPRLLQVESAQVDFDGFTALDIDQFEVSDRTLNVIIGPNGAGKTTLCDVISGKTRLSQGRVTVDGIEVSNLREADIARLGVGRKFQTPTPFSDNLTVYENLELALRSTRSLTGLFRRGPSIAERRQIINSLRETHLTDDRHRLAGELSHGQRQWLEIGMLMLTDPRLLLIDEPAAGLTDEETRQTADLLRRLGVEHSVVVIEHDMHFVRMLDAPVTVLHQGSILARGSIDALQENREVREVYLGG